MSVVAAPPRYTIEEFLALPDHKSYELVDGELVEVYVSNLSSWVGVKTSTMLANFSTGRRVGEVFGADSFYQCFPNRQDRARKPDVSFIRQERLPENWMADGYFTIAPDLAVEVLSPNDLVYKVQRKIREYLDAGVKLIWEINPEQRMILVHRANGTVTKLNESDTLSGEDVIPGFSCLVADLFPSKP